MSFFRFGKMSSQTGRMTGQRRKFSDSELDLNRDPPAEENVLQDQVPMIDVDAIDDDDVVESSALAFEQAKSNASGRRVRRRPIVLEDETREDPPNQTIISLNSSSTSVGENASKSPKPPKEPVFSCPICMEPLVEETSTRCGHIFCKACIKTAISTKAKCPTCRKKVAKNQLIRVFLPATN